MGTPIRLPLPLQVQQRYVSLFAPDSREQLQLSAYLTLSSLPPFEFLSPPASSPGKQLQWMSAPQETIPGCPPGLEYLTQIDQLLVHQQVEIFEGIFNGSL